MLSQVLYITGRRGILLFAETSPPLVGTEPRGPIGPISASVLFRSYPTWHAVYSALSTSPKFGAPVTAFKVPRQERCQVMFSMKKKKKKLWTKKPSMVCNSADYRIQESFLQVHLIRLYSFTVLYSDVLGIQYEHGLQLESWSSHARNRL